MIFERERVGPRLLRSFITYVRIFMDSSPGTQQAIFDCGKGVSVFRIGMSIWC